MNKVVSKYLKALGKVECYVLNVAPQPKPRMTYKDHWKPAAKRYFAYKDLVNEQLKKLNIRELPEVIPFIVFYIEPPKTVVTNDRKKTRRSLKKEEREALENTPVQKKPDIDNLVKALFDASESEDEYIWCFGSAKLYSMKPRIEIYL